jgi:asparagine synthase (glutamine-hydrolysing)
MFAFAIWDARAQHLFVARDRFGEKPLFLTRFPSGGVALASEVKAFFAHPEIDPRPDFDAVAKYVAGQYHESTAETLFVGIQRVPPAHALLIDPDGQVTRQWRYWTPDYKKLHENYNEGAAIREFRARLEKSIRLRLRSDVPVGTSLSGGLDSSMVVCLMARERTEDPNITQNTFSARFDNDPSISEGPQVDAVVSHTGVRAFSVNPSPLRLMEESRRLHWHQEEPFLSASIYLQWCVARLAREHQTTVLLDGQGADELLAGYQYYFKSYQLDCLDKVQIGRLIRDTRLFTSRLEAAAAAFPEARRRFNPAIAHSLRRVFALMPIPPSAFAAAYEVGLPAARRGGRLRRQLAEGLQYNSLPALLRYADRNSMAFGRETRLPFLDYELVDWCIGLPDEALIKNGWQKYIQRQAGEGLLPREIQWRADKVGYAAPLDAWLRGELKDWAYQRLFAGPITELRSYDQEEIRGIWDRHQSRVEDLSWPLWRWISLNEWLGLFEHRVWQEGLPGKG